MQHYNEFGILEKRYQDDVILIHISLYISTKQKEKIKPIEQSSPHIPNKAQNEPHLDGDCKAFCKNK